MTMRLTLGLALALMLASTARADPVADGTAGLQALDRGAYDEAIRLFSRAIAAGSLSQDDLEFAYLSRGKAYLGKGDQAHAASDLRQAAKMRPDDAEAQAALRTALAGQAEAPAAPQAGWGLLAQMAGRYYWYQIAGSDPQKAFYHAEWVTPGQLLAVSLRTRQGPIVLGEYALDMGGGGLLCASIISDTPSYATAKVRGNGMVEYSYFKNTPIKEAYALLPDSSVRADEWKFTDGAWRPTGTVTLVEVSKETLEAQGFLKKR